MRGFLSGAFAGVFVSGLGLGVASLMAPQPAGNTPPQPPQVAAPDGSAATGTEPAPQAPSAGDGSGPAGADAPSIAAPEGSAARPEVDTTPAEVPQTGGAPAMGQVPSAGQDPAQLGSDAPVLPSPQIAAPQAPGRESDISISTNPQQPVAPSAEEGAFLVIDPEAVTPVAPAADAAPQVPSAQSPANGQGSVDAQTSTTGAGAVAASEVAASVEARPPEAAAPSSEPAVSSGGAADAAAGAAPSAPAGAAATDAPATTTRPPVSNGIPQGAGTVSVHRSDSAAPAADRTPALFAYAVDFIPSEQRPLMGVVMIDDPAPGLGVAALGEVPFPVTVAIDATGPEATERMRLYREAGYEVLTLAALPQGATPQDVAVALEGAFATVTESIGYLDLAESPLSAEATGALVGRLAEDGFGYLALPAGLNAGARAADRAEVPNKVLLQDLDSAGQDARTIRRFLDRAAFRARQDSGVIVLTRLRAETISALALWSAASRASQISLAPVSAILLAQEDG